MNIEDMKMASLVGMKVKGFWGAMFPWSYGEIVGLEYDDAVSAIIEWDDDESGESYISVRDIKPANWENGPGESPIGIYFDEEE